MGRRVIIGRAGRLKPYWLKSTRMTICFQVTNSDFHNLPLPKARVRISEIGGEEFEFVNAETDEQGFVRFEVDWRQDIPIMVRIRHPQATAYQSYSVIRPDGIDLRMLEPYASPLVQDRAGEHP